MIDQIGIALTGVVAIGLSQSAPRFQRYACLFGLAGQPFWIYSAWHAGQWGVLGLTVLYTGAWCKGLWSHWLTSPKKPPEFTAQDELAFREGLKKWRETR